MKKIGHEDILKTANRDSQEDLEKHQGQERDVQRVLQVAVAFVAFILAKHLLNHMELVPGGNKSHCRSGSSPNCHRTSPPWISHHYPQFNIFQAKFIYYLFPNWIYVPDLNFFSAVVYIYCGIFYPFSQKEGKYLLPWPLHFCIFSSNLSTNKLYPTVPSESNRFLRNYHRPDSILSTGDRGISNMETQGLQLRMGRQAMK